MNYTVTKHIEIFRNILVKYETFLDGTICWKEGFLYPLNYDSYFQKLKAKYKFEKYLVSSEIETCKNILRWVNETMLFRDYDEYLGEYRADCILQYAISNRKILNCAMHSIVLTEVLSALGFKCRSIQCLPLDPLDNDSHFINLVFINNFHKWIALDPSFATFFLNSRNEYLNLRELRQYYLKDDFFKIVRHTRFPKSKGFDMNWYKAYLAKNLFRFSCIQGPLFTQMHNIIYYLEPNGYRECNQEEIVDNNIIRYICDSNFFWEG